MRSSSQRQSLARSSITRSMPGREDIAARRQDAGQFRTQEADTRTVIGLIRTNASSQFVDSAQYRFVRSWFNRKVARLRADFTSSVSAAPYVQIQEISPQSRVYWVNFAGEMVLLTMTGSVWSNYSSAFYTALGVDGVFDANLMSCISNYADGYARLLSGASNFEPSGGYHYGNFGSQATGNVTTTWSYCGIVGLILP